MNTTAEITTTNGSIDGSEVNARAEHEQADISAKADSRALVEDIQKKVAQKDYEQMLLNSETIVRTLREASTTALERLQAGDEMRPMIFITGRDGRRHEVTARVDDEKDEKDLTLWSWLRAIECDAQMLLSITMIRGRTAEDSDDKVRHYLMVASCARGTDGNEHWACMSELPAGWKMSQSPVPVGEPTCTTPGMRSLGDTPTLYGFPEHLPSGPERAEARRRLDMAQKRRNKGKRPFTDAIHTKIGW